MELFEEHMKRNHAEQFEAEQLAMVVEMSGKPITPTIEHCPFCAALPVPVGIITNMEEHVGQHLRHFALISLPLPEDIDARDESQDGNWSNDDDNISDGNTRLAFSSVAAIHDSIEDVESSEIEAVESSGSEGCTPQLTEYRSRNEQYGFLESIITQSLPFRAELLGEKPYRSLAEFAERKFQLLSVKSPLVPDVPELPKATNILILGQTGVGKSTWINAFINYVRFPTLDEALQENQPFQWIIPFAFEVNNVNDDGEYEAVKVKVGFDKMEQAAPNSVVAEKDGISGASSTQITAVHRVKDGKRIIRLIDTPGIGDTEGTESDKKNMADILCVLRSYRDIHGILILLKPNDQKLSLMFKFCIQELLANLHRDAARNIVFGFTNTRGTNYMPGNTFGPLRDLLSQHKDTVDIPFNSSHVYCFDSESFRFLAAQKTCNQTIGNLDENRTSWDKSVEESRRLINYFQGLTPHNVRSTVNLYETRYRIVSLTKPMAEIAAAIEATIRINDDEIRDLQESNSLKVNLEKSLRTRVLKPTAVRVEMPLTTCSDKACVTYLDSGTKGLDGRAILTTNYKSKCHSPCYLEGVALENIGDAALRSCWAMNRGEFCRQCGHVWNSHLHINYELKYIYEEVNNPAIEEQLQKNADIQAQKEASIALKTRQISELEAELAKIRDTAAQFSVFLRANAILPYNDATLEYLQRQIDEESAKVAFGGSRDKLDNLTSYHQQYKQQVDILEKCRHQKQHQMLFDQLGVETALAELQSLKIYGAMLRNLEEAIRSSEESASREKGPLMRAKTNWGAKPRKPVQSHVKSLSTSPEDRVSLSNISPLSQAADGTPTSRTAQTGSLTPETIVIPTTALDKKPEKPLSWRRRISKNLSLFWNSENDP
ncbi:hypothetical protein K4F52_009878 [Lecanicillium sp. MT-2017a]|nr:hypothetical protein K4F52_009878 [Lecanicillium sp. MT-2017a]